MPLHTSAVIFMLVVGVSAGDFFDRESLSKLSNLAMSSIGVELSKAEGVGKLHSSPACMAKCKPQFEACFGDKQTGCGKSFAGSMACLAWNSAVHHKSADELLACFIPDNRLRDDVLYCLIEKNECIQAGKDNTTYEVCRDEEVIGDAKFRPEHLYGDWWKIKGYKLGEPVECRPCQTASFRKYTAGAVGYPIEDPQDLTDYTLFSSLWNEKDSNGKIWPMNQSSLWGPRPKRAGFPNKQMCTGMMYGLTYYENYTVVHDGTQEVEPFVLFYVCGKTMQGAYPAGLAFGKMPTASMSLKARIADVLAQNGFRDEDWCDVDNSCSDDAERALIV